MGARENRHFRVEFLSPPPWRSAKLLGYLGNLPFHQLEKAVGRGRRRITVTEFRFSLEGLQWIPRNHMARVPLAVLLRSSGKASWEL